MSNPSSNPSIGILQSFILADQIFMDARTGKYTIVGTFDKLYASMYPGWLSRTSSAYLRLSDFRGCHKLRIGFIDLNDESVLMESPEIEFENSDPNVSRELIMEIPPFPMPHPGWFEFVVFCDGIRIGRIRMELFELKERTEE